MPISQGRNFLTRKVDDIALGKFNDQLVSPAHGKYLEHTQRGNMYWVNTVVAGLGIPQSDTTAPLVMLWNPAGSGVDAFLAKFAASQASDTTATSGNIGLVSISGTELDATIASGSAITAFNQSVVGTNLFNGRLNNGNKSKIKASANGTNTVVAGAWIKTLGMSFGANITTSSVTTGTRFVYDFDGEMILPPGTAVFVASGNATGANALLFHQSLSWYEVPVS